MPVLSVVIPRLKTNQLRWTFTGAFVVMLMYFYMSSVINFHQNLGEEERISIIFFLLVILFGGGG